MKTRGIVNIGTYNILIPEQGSPKEVAMVLSSIPTFKQLDEGEATAAFIAAGFPRRMMLIGQSQEVDFFYYLQHNYVIVDKRGKQSFKGTLARFCEWAKLSVPVGLVSNLVQFEYDGGTEPGRRTIHVEKVEPSGTGYVIEGYDVAKPEFRPLDTDSVRKCYRRFLSDKIISEIKVIS